MEHCLALRLAGVLSAAEERTCDVPKGWLSESGSVGLCCRWGQGQESTKGTTHAQTISLPVTTLAAHVDGDTATQKLRMYLPDPIIHRPAPGRDKTWGEEADRIGGNRKDAGLGGEEDAGELPRNTEGPHEAFVHMCTCVCMQTLHGTRMRAGVHG